MDQAGPRSFKDIQATAPDKPSRLFFIDHLRASLVILVVLHHVAVTYGSGAPFYYVEPAFNDPLAFLLLLVFTLVNQSWFMGALFLFSGYFTPGSYDRKGPGPFLKDRLIRLGLPLLIFYFVLNPLSCIGYWQMPSSLTGITTPLTWQAYPHLLGLGPLWFVALLLVFEFGYAGWRMLTRNRISALGSKSSLPGHLHLGLFILALALASYLVRMVIPLGKQILGFPTLAYLPQYLAFFVLGAFASGQGWLRTLPRSMGWAGFVTALAAGVLLFPLAFSGRLFSLELTPALTESFGKGHWRSAVYALWDSTFAVGICLALVPLFRRFFNGRSGIGRFLSRHSYAVYLIHTPILVFIAVALKGVGLEHLLKFGLAAVIVVPTCFAVAYLVRLAPSLSRIL